MGFKINHYAAKTISRSNTMDWETVAIELIIGAICGIIAMAGFKANMLLIFVPAVLITLICFAGACYNLYFWIVERREKRTKQ
ncbi:hypothetical protein [Pseudoalteromonas viridis]|uniref:Uncharacterized protein n=1 Tax=Pseudoalteromonas viridis TaxID=339617 RepID=A0ABX7V0E2_9GAMM|nr:hypothetical protein [Pseudoalteromonas viridis]QTL34348.1 hypothetical protein J5X90_12345 [Pseudoalteromonas viridis]